MGITIFTPAPLPANENRRNEAAIQSGLLNRIGDPAFTQIANETCHVMDVDWCGVTLMVGDEQHVIASSGGTINMFRRSTSLCSYAIYSPTEVFYILDAASDDRFAGNPLVDDGIISFFAGVAILDHAGYAIGVLCIIDRIPRTQFSNQECLSLHDYSSRVTATLNRS